MMYSRLSLSRFALLGAATLLCAHAVPVRAADTVAQAQPLQSSFVLPAKPSEMLRAPALAWEPVLKQVTVVVRERAEQADTLSKPTQIELAIHQTVLSQAKRDWPGVFAGVKKTRRLQDSESGQQMAGLLNEVLARQVVDKGDSAWLQQHLRDRVLAMPWEEVEPSVRTLREQLAASNAEGIEDFAAKKMDVSASVTRNTGSLGFVMQLLGMRFQLLEVMPRRDALVAGLDEAIARHSAAGK